MADGDGADAKDGRIALASIMEAQEAETAEGAQFLAREREALAWNDQPAEDDNAWMAEAIRRQSVIRDTPAKGLTAARVKASLLLRLAEQFEGRPHDVAGLRSLVETLRNGGAQ